EFIPRINTNRGFFHFWVDPWRQTTVGAQSFAPSQSRKISSTILAVSHQSWCGTPHLKIRL
ncbi:hypothetical protein, partial [Coleofasciculus sp.]|uniref:hypothetical protein n=1 Tax=Coleofasciculus sp. TaxID=3100458 RepID=UPI003A20CE1A